MSRRWHVVWPSVRGRLKRLRLLRNSRRTFNEASWHRKILSARRQHRKPSGGGSGGNSLTKQSGGMCWPTGQQMSSATPKLPKQWSDFLDAVDRALLRPVELHWLGWFGLEVAHSPARVTGGL